MKRKSVILSLAVLLIMAVNCRSTKNVEYEIFDGLRPEDKAFILASAERGKFLFKDHCAKCHGIFSKGKKEVTDFSQEQLHDYKQSFLAEDKENHAVIDQLTSQQLDDILRFLTFVKR